MPVLSLNDLVAIGLCVLALLALGMNLLVHRKHPYIGLRKTSAVRSSEILSQAAAEQGKRLTIGLGLDVADSVTAMASLPVPVSYTHLRAHETVLDLVCRLLLEKKKKPHTKHTKQMTYAK